MSNKRATAEAFEVEGEGSEVHDEPHEPLLDRLEHVGHNITEFVVQRPLTAVGIALGLGFVLGRALRRW